MGYRSILLPIVVLLGSSALAEDGSSAPPAEAEAVASAQPTTSAATGSADAVTSDVMEIKWTDVTAQKQVKPVVPPFAKLTRPIRCKIQFTIDEGGLPVGIGVDECPAALQANAEKAANRWRFDPYMVEGQARKARFSIIVVINH